MNALKEARKRVRRGIAVLNKARPSWVKSISVKDLRLESCELCVLGQLYQNDYYRGLAILNGKVEEDPEAFGFCEDAEVDSELLDQVWAEEIAKQRRLARKAAA
jgi:hypothetical protein